MRVTTDTPATTHASARSLLRSSRPKQRRPRLMSFGSVFSVWSADRYPSPPANCLTFFPLGLFYRSLSSVQAVCLIPRIANSPPLSHAELSSDFCILPRLLHSGRRSGYWTRGATHHVTATERRPRFVHAYIPPLFLTKKIWKIRDPFTRLPAHVH